MDWQGMCQLALRKDHNGRTLVLTVEVESLTIIALETNTQSNDAGEMAIESVMASHAHRFIGSMPDLATAISVSEKFAEDWEGGTPLSQCTCGEDLPEPARTGEA